MHKPSRGLSLTDLVNHDDAPPLAGSASTASQPEQTAAVGKTADDETDTDDEPGEIVFENTKFKFDEEERDAREAKVKKERQREAKTDAEQPKCVKEEEEGEEARAVLPEEPKQAKMETGDIFQQKSSNASVKNNIKKDLKILSELSTNSLPKKYNIVPVWARKWKPTVKALQSIDSKNFKLEDSILSFIPDDDLTKSVQDWIYATLVSIEPPLRQFLEIEMKYGVIIDPTSSSRVNPPVSSQCVFTDADSTMKPDIDERVFDEFNKYMKNISDLNENMGKFNIIDSHTSDLSYRVRTHTERPKFLRMTRDVNTDRIAQFIEKRKISQLLLYSPKDSYDTKISISLELPVPDNEPPEKYKNHTPIGNRIKKRTSYIHNDSCTRFDITRAESKPIKVNSRADKEPESETTFEVELEMNTPALLNTFDNIQHDSKDYASIVRTFLNNGTIVRRKLSSLSYEIFEGSKKL